ncbi:UDP-xylose and UDP-N-acetylglucosamine transporter [Drosophila busckii]|uniref:UDP-xylose and UDP-N-acetylglucosamine transporter n=1 Tax=Drosophila busckii TaxID=30019 RepID=UPI00083EC1AD|nr:UDP-xylose and UDP-N-acetylglucosamine transporter [Drosophila busckii]XP_017846530.1 UDP-xylose and UDP-N-acetylglucosamine transporter [Drosophila busckii]
MKLTAILATASVLIGCCFAVVFLELLVKLDPGAGNLITFTQFAFIALEGFIFTAKFGAAKRVIGLKDYGLLVGMFFVTSVINNYVFQLNVPMTLHMIIRGGSLISNMCLGSIILNRHYKFEQYVAVLMLSVGIFICTYCSSQDVERVKDNQHESNFVWWLVGVLLLVLALFISSYMGITQELLYRRHGKHAREALYYTHLLPLPAFLFMHDNISAHWTLALQGERYICHWLGGLAVPLLLVYLLGNVLMQHLCISSVYFLTTEYSSLTVTLILTLRKFISLVFSIIYFRNPFTIYHWLGTVLVFVGTLMFTNILNFKRKVKNK